ncbi:MAG: hypothetical protein QOD73_2102 [Solirubrobacteraceae bacterium]|nr:hypothetical protein [Solirubrobacteraceae bacterium]
MSFLRHTSTRRLLAVLASCLLVAGAGAAAIAMAAGGAGPVPPPKQLAAAVHDALAAPQPDGVTARIEFTNHLIDAASLQGADPLLTGATGRLWASGDRLRLELQASNAGGGAGDVQVLVDGDRLTVIDIGANTIYRATLPAHDTSAGNAPEPVPSLARIQEALAKLAEHVTVSDAQPSNVAGRAAYTVRISPRHDGGLFGAVEAAWDAANGVPLRAAVYADGNSSPVLELKATDVSFGTVADSDMTVPEPSGAKVIDLSPPASAGAPDPKDPASAQKDQPAMSLSEVQAKVPFHIVAPAELVGLKRQAVKLVDMEGSAGALVSYGQGLGGIVVLQTPAKPADKGAAGGGDRPGLSLPKISVNGVSGQELDTALGTVLRFERDGVSYTVAGSVPPAAAEAAARGL